MSDGESDREKTPYFEDLQKRKTPRYIPLGMLSGKGDNYTWLTHRDPRLRTSVLVEAISCRLGAGEAQPQAFSPVPVGGFRGAVCKKAESLKVNHRSKQ